MIANVLLLSLGTFASPVIISDVKATLEPGHLRVEVRGNDGIDPEAAHARIDDGRLFLFLGGTRVHADNRSWELSDGSGSVRAHRHRLETEIVVPLTRNGCSGPVELTPSENGLTALVGCEGLPVAAAPVSVVESTRTKRTQKLDSEEAPRAIAVADKPLSVPRVAAEVAKPTSAKPIAANAAAPMPASAPATEPLVVALPTEAEQLKALVALPSPTGRVESSAAVAKAAAADKDGEDEDAEGDTKVEKKKIEKASQPIVEKLNGKTVPAALVAAPVANPASATAGSTPGIALPVVGLLALAGIGYVFARRRKIQGYRHIQIVETASLGPKRALVVARVGEQTLILGSSEAGITLLRTQTDERAAGVVEATLPTNEIDVPISDALADIPEPSVEIPTALARPGFRAIEGGLASLFGKRGDAKRATDLRETQSTGDESFDDILEDSVEDQELRRKLAAGLSARAR